MGQVYSPEQVTAGEVPAAGGIDQLQAAAFFMNSLRGFLPTNLNTRILIPGSIATGQATRRSDVDYLLVDSSCDRDGEPLISSESRMRQRLHITGTIRYVTERFHVHLEGKTYTDAGLARMGNRIYDALWLSHALDIQDNYPDWSHRKPLEILRPYAVDIHNLTEPREISLTGAVATRYMDGKVSIFEEAGEFNPDSRRDLLRFQRALEAPKAYARKMIAVSALEGCHITNPDVTSRQNMRDQTNAILDRIDTTGKMRRYNDLLVGLDREYDQVLDEALKSDSISEYEMWLAGNYLASCALALRLAHGYARHIDEVTLWHPSIDYGRFGIDINEEYDTDFALEHSLSEPLDDGENEIHTDALEELSDPVNINLSHEEIDELIDQLTRDPQRQFARS